MSVNAVATRFKFSTAYSDLEIIKQHLRLSHNAEDGVLMVKFAAAKEAADNYMQNDFLNDDLTLKTIPSVVGEWLLERIARGYEHRIEGLKNESISGVGSQEWSSEEFIKLEPYRVNPGF
jgi:Phage gp6-like head-tail connector protein